MVVPADQNKQVLVHLLHAKIGSHFHFRRDRGCRLPVRREVAYSRVADGQGCSVFSTEKRRDRDSGADGTAARATRPEPLQAAPLACLLDAAVRSLNHRLWAAGSRSGSPGAARACRARVERLADGKRASSGACRVPVGAGPPRRRSGRPGTPGSRVAEGRKRDRRAGPGPRAQRPVGRSLREVG